LYNKKINLNFILTCLITFAVVGLSFVLFYNVTMAYFKDQKSASATINFGAVGVEWSNSSSSSATPSMTFYKESNFTTSVSTNNLSDLVKGKTYYFGNNELFIRNTGGTAMYMRISITFEAQASNFTFSFTNWTKVGDYYYYTNGTSYLVSVSGSGYLAVAGSLAVADFVGVVSEEIDITLNANGTQVINSNVVSDNFAAQWTS